MSRNLQLSYSGPVSADGAIAIPKRARKEIAQVFAGQSVEVIIKKLRRSRSNQQNRYYWGVVVAMVLQALYDLGNQDLKPGHPDSVNLVHEFLKNKFLPPVIATDAQGQELQLPPSTRKQNTVEMLDYIAEIQMWAAEFLNIVIPDPGEQMELF
jgi:hypothetical protein